MYKDQLKKQIDNEKKKAAAVNFQQAELIRQQEKDLSQAQFFYKELRKMQNKEVKEKTILDTQQGLKKVAGRIQKLENVEMEMLSNLQKSVSEHQKLLGLVKNGNLDSISIQSSQKNFHLKSLRNWK